MIAVIKPTTTFEQLLTRLLMWLPERKIKGRYNKEEISECMSRVSEEQKDEWLLSGRYPLSNGVVYSTNCLSLSTASIEMSTVAHSNPRCTKPAWNMVISWARDEHVNDEDIFHVIDLILAELGMGEHQRVFAIFRTSERLFSRIIVNRVHPETKRVVNIYQDAIRLNRIVRECNERGIQ